MHTETLEGYAVLIDGKSGQFFASSGNPGNARAFFHWRKEATAYAKELRFHNLKCRVVKVTVTMRQAV